MDCHYIRRKGIPLDGVDSGCILWGKEGIWYIQTQTEGVDKEYDCPDRSTIRPIANGLGNFLTLLTLDHRNNIFEKGTLRR